MKPAGDCKSSPGSRLPLLSARPAVTFLAEERHHLLTNAKLYCLVTEAHRCEQLAQGCYAALSQWELNPWPIDCKSNAIPLCHCATHRNCWGVGDLRNVIVATGGQVRPLFTEIIIVCLLCVLGLLKLQLNIYIKLISVYSSCCHWHFATPGRFVPWPWGLPLDPTGPCGKETNSRSVWDYLFLFHRDHDRHYCVVSSGSICCSDLPWRITIMRSLPVVSVSPQCAPVLSKHAPSQHKIWGGRPLITLPIPFPPSLPSQSLPRSSPLPHAFVPLPLLFHLLFPKSR